MRRREFFSLLAGAAAWPLAARAQPALPTVGYLSSLSQPDSAHLVDAFRRGLAEGGFVEKQTVAIDYSFADGLYDRLPAMAKDLVARGANVLVSTGGYSAILAAKAATSTIPIVFSTGIDPVKAGVIASFNRPGGNITGVYVVTTGLEPKRFSLLQELVPASAAIALLTNSTNPSAASQAKDVEDAARVAGRPLHLFQASPDRDLEVIFAAIGEAKPAALMIASDPWLNIRRDQLVGLAARYSLPTMYQWREFAEAGGLMSYGTNLADSYRQVGVYTARVLKGANPAELPVLQPTKFELVINLKTAKALNMQIPAGVLAIADEVIE